MVLLSALEIQIVTPKEWPNALTDAPGMAKVTAIVAQWGAVAIAATAGIAIAIAALRLIGGRRARRQRRTVLLKPSSQFDPSPEEVLRFSGQLLRVHSATSRVTIPGSTRTIRVKLVSAGEGRMAQLLEGPAAAEQILRHRGFAQVELADPATVLDPTAVTRTEARSTVNDLEVAEEEAAEPPPSSGVERSGGSGGGGVEDPWGPDIGIDAEDWLDTDHDAHVDDPPQDLEWMHPEEQRLYPVPEHPQWGCLDERGDER